MSDNRFIGASSWARAPDRGIVGTPEKRRPAADASKDGTFSPKLDSDPELRAKVPSSGYGRELLMPGTPAPEVNSKEEEELAAATFKPDLNVSDVSTKLRKMTTSSSYGKALPPKKEYKGEERPSFRPKTALGKQAKALRRAAPSSGYGKVAAESPSKLRGRPEQLAFQPDLKVGKTAERLRKKAPSKTYLQERPRTAPAATREPTVMRYTLAADHSEDTSPYKEEDVDVNGPFVLDCNQVASQMLDPRASVLPSPEPVKLSSASRKLKENTPSSGYGGPEYMPEIGEVPSRDAKPDRLQFGKPDATVYAATAEDLQPSKPTSEAIKLKERVVTTGYGSAEYTPPVAEAPSAKSPEPVWKPAYGSSMVSSEEMPAPVKSRLNDTVSSSCYGIVSPDVVPRKEKPPQEKQFRILYKNSTAMLPVSMLGTEAEGNGTTVRSVTGRGYVMQGEQESLAATSP